MLKPLVSVLMPVYNAEKYLSQAIESILKQTFKDFEFIIINDGSTDGSELILKDFQKTDQRIKVFSRENQGLIATLNEGINYAKGDYIARMDADDIAFPERFAKQVAFLRKNPEYVAVGSQVLLIDSEGWPIALYAPSQLTKHEDIDQVHLQDKGGAICHPAVMIRNNTLKQLGGYRTQVKHAEDLDLFLRLAEVGKITNLPETLLKYRMHLKSIGHTRRQDQLHSGQLAVLDAHRRRGLTPPTKQKSDVKNYASISDIHRKWAWWALSGGNVATARKHAFLALKHNPVTLQSWKVFACAIRGY